MASVAAHHAEWLSLVDVSGPFLSVGVLKESLPNGLDAHDPHVAAEVRAALEQWADPDGAGLGSVSESEVHRAFVRFVLHEVLGFDDEVLRWDTAATSASTVEVPHVGVLTPDAVLMDGEQTVMLVAVVGPGIRADEIDAETRTLTPQERMVEHLMATGLRIGLVTDGERWTLVSYREGDNPGFATWWSSLWGEEKITLQAFRTLLHQDRFLTMRAEETIIGLLDRSAEDQREVTTKLGNQTLQAVEILLRTIDRIDHERGGELLREVPVAELYDAAVTVMMRLIFLFYAEENDLLPVAEPLYIERYAASTLRERLQAAADQHGEEVLETTHDGWPRLLATWRAVFGGVEHGDMVLAPYGGSLFDPDRYPFLEGRQPGTSWMTDEAETLPVDNRTVLHLLNALQTLDEGGQRRKLSFRALDVEQIGHVYEGMLDHTAARATGWVLGLSGTGGRDPEIELDYLESLEEKALLDFLSDTTGREVRTLHHWLEDGDSASRTRFGSRWSAKFTEERISARIRRFGRLLREDSTGAPTVFEPSSIYVCDSAHRGATGTHYTPRALAEEVVETTLSPLVYDGPAIGLPPENWKLKSSGEIASLCICDPACGSGAFLVSACRYLGLRLAEARSLEGNKELSEEAIVLCRREVAERCLFGVDANPMACEMAKMSLWLITLARDRPFGFLDHAIRHGDSLIGLASLDQMRTSHLIPERGRKLHDGSLFDPSPLVEALATSAAELDKASSIESDVLASITARREADSKARMPLAKLRTIADALVSAQLSPASNSDADAASVLLASQLGTGLVPHVSERSDWPEGRQFMHWPIDFPSVFQRERPGFDAIVSNPPFIGNKYWKERIGRWLQPHYAFRGGKKLGKPDLIAVFAWRLRELVRSGGTVGMIATQSITETQTRRLFEAQFLNEMTIVQAVANRDWPGLANVQVSLIWAVKGDWDGQYLVDGSLVEAIGPDLRAAATSFLAVPVSSPLHVFEGVHNGKGLAFVLNDLHPLVARGYEQLKPYLSGDDLTSGDPRTPKRYVIDLSGLSERELNDLPDELKEFVYRIIKPTRSPEALKSYAGLADRWWTFWNTREDGFRESRKHEKCVVVPAVSKYHFAFQLPSAWVFTNKAFVFPLERVDLQTLLLSSHFEYWLVRTGGSRDTRRTITKGAVVDTFPQPPSEVDNSLGNAWQQTVFCALDAGYASPRKLMDAVSDPSVINCSLANEMREIRRTIDAAVQAAYGKSTHYLDYGFFNDGEARYGLLPESQNRLLQMLATENHREGVL